MLPGTCILIPSSPRPGGRLKIVSGSPDSHAAVIESRTSTWSTRREPLPRLDRLHRYQRQLAGHLISGGKTHPNEATYLMTRTTRALFRVCLFTRCGCVCGFTWPPLRCHDQRHPMLYVCSWKRVGDRVVRAATCGVHLVRPLALYALTARQINEQRTERIYDLLLDIRGTWRQYRCSASDREDQELPDRNRNRSSTINAAAQYGGYRRAIFALVR